MVDQLAAEPCRPLTCIAPCSWDKIIIINLPKSLEPRVTMLVETGWGIQETKILQKTRNGCCLRLKLVGNPWNGETGQAGVQVRNKNIKNMDLAKEGVKKCEEFSTFGCVGCLSISTKKWSKNASNCLDIHKKAT